MMPIQERRRLAQEAVKHGRWIIRCDYNGRSPLRSDFRWNEPGEWNVAPDFNTKQECGGGLHGQDRYNGGEIFGSRLVFCDYEGPCIPLYGKVKVQKARILLVNELPEGLVIDGDLDLSIIDLRGITLPKHVGGNLDLTCCKIGKNNWWNRLTGKVTILPQMVGGKVYTRHEWVKEEIDGIRKSKFNV